MAILIDNEGNKFEFEPLTYKEENLIKVNIKEDGQGNEGIWAVVSDADKLLHDADLNRGRFVCMLANHALAFYPKPSWGLHMVAEWNGDERPLRTLTGLIMKREVIEFTDQRFQKTQESNC